MKSLVSVPKGTTFDTFFTPENINLLNSLGNTVWNTGNSRMTKDELCEMIRDCDVYFALWGSPKIDADVLEKANKLKLITVLGSTVTPFVSDAVWEKGIKVISAFDWFSESTAEAAIAYILCSLRKIPYFTDRLKKDRIWKKESDRTEGLIHRSVGIISYGGVGKHLVKKLSVFNVDIKVYDIRKIDAAEKERYGFNQCGIEEIFSSCDVISINTPYNQNTHHMINERLMSMIKPGALLLNTSRGGVVDQKALTEHLKNGDFNAALDGYETEPIDMDDPLLDLDNVLMLPHQGGVTTDLRPLLTKELINESYGFIEKGQPLKNEISSSYAKTMSKN